MKYTIRQAKPSEYSMLGGFLYEAIFIPEGVEPPPKDIIDLPELQVYTENFGSRKGNICFLAENDNNIIGAAWTRIMNDYGHVDADTPSLAIALYNQYRGHGIGTALMHELLSEVKNQGFTSVSLAVQKANYAYRMYKKLGFETVRETEEEYIMVIKL